MPKSLECDRARRALRGLGKNQLAQFGQQRSGQTQQTIGHDQTHRHDQRRLRHRRLGRHGVDQLFEQNRHAHIGKLGCQHAQERKNQTPFVLPQVGKEPFQGGGKWLAARVLGICGQRVG